MASQPSCEIDVVFDRAARIIGEDLTLGDVCSQSAPTSGAPTFRRRWMSVARFVAHYVRANFEVALAYRAAFLAKALAFVVSDAMWVAFWWLYFERFQVSKGTATGK